MKLLPRLGILVLAILLLNVACKGDEQMSKTNLTYEAVYLTKDTYLILAGPEEGQLIRLNNISEELTVGDLVRFATEGMKESYPLQAEVTEYEIATEGPHSYVKDFEFEAEFRDHLPDASTTIDVRTKEEYETGKLKHALNIPVDNIEDIEKLNLPKDHIIFVYCRSGVRSATAAEKLVDLGYELVFDIGGILDYSGELD